MPNDHHRKNGHSLGWVAVGEVRTRPEAGSSAHRMPHIRRPPHPSSRKTQFLAQAPGKPALRPPILSPTRFNEEFDWQTQPFATPIRFERGARVANAAFDISLYPRQSGLCHRRIRVPRTPIYSHSRLSSFENCPKAVSSIGYIQKIPSESERRGSLRRQASPRDSRAPLHFSSAAASSPASRKS